MSQLAVANDLVYTRYSDDLTFSAATPFNRPRAVAIIGHVRNVVEDKHFVVHEKKTRIVPPGARHVVLGLQLGQDRPELLPEFKRRIEVHIRGVDRFGLTAHAAHRRFRSVFSFVKHLDGCIAFAQAVEPERAESMRNHWNAVLMRQGYPASTREP